MHTSDVQAATSSENDVSDCDCVAIEAEINEVIDPVKDTEVKDNVSNNSDSPIRSSSNSVSCNEGISLENLMNTVADYPKDCGSFPDIK